MRQIALFAAVGLSTLLLFSQEYSSQSLSLIEGVVLEGSTERPLSGVTVSAVMGEIVRVATSDSQGHFVIELPDSGRYFLTPNSEGMVYFRSGGSYQPHRPGVWVQVSSGEHVKDVSLHMVRAGVISGRALGSDGKPFPAVRGSVSVHRNSYDAYGKKGIHGDSWVHFGTETNTVARMDDRGDFRLYGLQPGDYYVFVNGGGSHSYYPGTADVSQAKPIHVGAGEEVHLGTIALPVHTSTLVRIHISDFAGNPLTSGVSGALTLLSSSGDALTFFTGFQTRGAPVDTSTVRTISLAPGHYDFTVGLTELAANSDMQYGQITLNVGNSEMDLPLKLSRGIRVSGSISTEDTDGNPTNIYGLLCKLHTDLPHVESIGASTCFGAQYSPGVYQLEVTGMPPDAYVESAVADGKDILAQGLQLDSDTEIRVRIRSTGGTLDGTVKDTDGKPMPEAAVALVPDEPLRNAQTFYRFVTSDVHGKYELRGIAPGSYHLFAWTELDGAAYLNKEFMKDYYEKGTPLKIDGIVHVSLSISVLN